jgi:putative membrane protein insertion efficiency factor
MVNRRQRLRLPLWLAVCVVVCPALAGASPAALRAPKARAAAPPAQTAAAGPLGQPLLGAIRLFQTYISPTDGARCQFAPTCSVYGHRAIRDHGPWLGLLMTTDRLMRCSYWTDPAGYPHLPNGRLADPVAAKPEGP